jgi:hypothetical protein
MNLNEYNTLKNEYNTLTNVCDGNACASEPHDLRTAVRKEDEVLHQLQDILVEIYSVLTGELPQKDGIKGANNFCEAVWCNVDRACFIRDTARDILRELRG